MALDQYRAAGPGPLPAAGRPVVAGIQLPAGRLIAADPQYRSDGLDTPTAPVLWITEAVVSDRGELWGRLARAFPETATAWSFWWD